VYRAGGGGGHRRRGKGGGSGLFRVLTGPFGLVLLGIAVVLAIGYGAKWYQSKGEPAVVTPAAKTGSNGAAGNDQVQAPATNQTQTPPKTEPPKAAQPAPEPADPNKATVEGRSHIDRAGGAQQTMLVTAYYYDGLKASDTLVPVQIRVPLSVSNIKVTAELIVQAPEEFKLYSNVPKGTKVNSVNLKDGVAYVDLSAEAGNVQGSAAAVAMQHAFVYSLTEIPNVKAVQVQILGRPAMLHGIEWSKPLSRADLKAQSPVAVDPLIKFVPKS
jgi:spore germination protein GerM